MNRIEQFKISKIFSFNFNGKIFVRNFEKKTHNIYTQINKNPTIVSNIVIDSK